MGTSTDAELWAAVVTAQRALIQAQNAFYNGAELRREVLVSALRSGRRSVECFAALEVLDRFSDDVPYLVDELVDVVLDEDHAPYAARALFRRRHAVGPEVREIVLRSLAGAGAYDFRLLSGLLWHLRDDDGLRELVNRARQSDDPEIREVADDFDES